MRFTALCLAALLALAAARAEATVLTFDATYGLLNGSELSTYGDNVVAAVMGDHLYGLTYGTTPDIVVDFEDSWNTWPDLYGDLVNVVYPNGDGNQTIRLTASGGYVVALHSFDMGGWPKTDQQINSVQVLDGNDNVLWSAPLNGNNLVTIEGDLGAPLHSSFIFNTPLMAPVLKIVIDGTNTQYSYIAVDNIAFSQEIPEPASLSLMGLAALALVRRRR